MSKLGYHIICEYRQCDANILKNLKLIKDTMLKSSEILGADVRGVKSHKFEGNGGVSVLVILALSHIAIHTWPELHYANVDLFFCKTAPFNDSLNLIKETLNAKEAKTFRLTAEGYLDAY